MYIFSIYVAWKWDRATAGVLLFERNVHMTCWRQWWKGGIGVQEKNMEFKYPTQSSPKKHCKIPMKGTSISLSFSLTHLSLYLMSHLWVMLFHFTYCKLCLVFFTFAKLGCWSGVVWLSTWRPQDWSLGMWLWVRLSGQNHSTMSVLASYVQSYSIA